MNADRFGISISVTIVAYMLVVIQLLKNNSLESYGIPILIIVGLFLLIMTIYALEKKSIKINYKISTKEYLVYFFVGVFFGIIILISLDSAYSADL